MAVSESMASSFQSFIRFLKDSITIKFFVLLFLTMILWLPLGMIGSVQHGREQRHDEAKRDIQDAWGSEQVLTAPVLSVPVSGTATENGKTVSRQSTVHLLP
jgi:inner membrane protein